MRISQKGFTLTELLATIAIISILSSVTIVSLNSLMPTLRLKGGARQLISDIRKTQGWAVEEQNIHQIKLTINSGSYTLERVENPAEIRETVALPRNIFVSNLSANIVGGEIRFNAAGGSLNYLNAPLGEATITLINQKGSRLNIIISPSGTAKIQ